MAYIVRMPKLGVEMEEGVVLEWHAAEGESVEEGGLVAEIESEKSQAEVAARESGVVRSVLLAEGEEGEPGAAMGIVAGPDEDIGELLAEAGVDPDLEAGADSNEDSSADAPASATAGVADETAPQAATSEAGATAADDDGIRASPKAKRRADELDVDLSAVEGTGPQGSVTAQDVEGSVPDEAATTEESGAAASTPATGGGSPALADEVKASPRARRRAGELGVDVTRVEGTGPQDSVVEADVERAAARGEATAAAEAGGATAASAGGADASESGGATGATGTAEFGGVGDLDRSRTVAERREQSRMRQTIARRLSESWREAPHVTVDRRVDAEPLFAALEAAEASGYDVSTTDVLLRAVSETLSAHPEFNGTFEDGVHTLYEEQHVGVAVDVNNGLITPVIPDVGAKTVDEIASVRGELTDRALANDYTGDDLSGGTFTVSNLGVFGVDSFTPVINPPEVAILGVNGIDEKPVRGDRGGVEWRRHIGFSLSFDHRVVDGADAAKFLATLAEELDDAVALVP